MAARGGASKYAIIRGMKKIIPFCGVALSSLVVCAEGGGIVKLFPEDVKTVTYQRWLQGQGDAERVRP